MTQRTLVVDDDRVTRLMMRHMLTQFGHQVTVAGSLADAGSVARSEHPMIVICDLQLPDGIGLDLLPVLGELPQRPGFIVVTGVAERTDISDERIFHVDHFLTKPVSSAELEAAVAAVRVAR